MKGGLHRGMRARGGIRREGEGGSTGARVREREEDVLDETVAVERDLELDAASMNDDVLERRHREPAGRRACGLRRVRTSPRGSSATARGRGRGGAGSRRGRSRGG